MLLLQLSASSQSQSQPAPMASGTLGSRKDTRPSRSYWPASMKYGARRSCHVSCNLPFLFPPKPRTKRAAFRPRDPLPTSRFYSPQFRLHQQLLFASPLFVNCLVCTIAIFHEAYAARHNSWPFLQLPLARLRSPVMERGRQQTPRPPRTSVAQMHPRT